MAAKVKWDRGAWWVFTHYESKRTKKRVGTTKADRQRAVKIAEKINAALALGTFRPDPKAEKPLACDHQLRAFRAAYTPTWKPSYEILVRGLIENHLAPHFGAHDLREIREADLLEFIRVKLDAGLTPGTIRNALSVLRRLFTVLVREGILTRNPATAIGEMMRRVRGAMASETEEVEYWTRREVQALIETARVHEARFAPMLVLLLSTGMRRGEAIGLNWTDVDFNQGTLTVRRAITAAGVTTPKSGKARRVAMAPALASELLDLLGDRRREALARGWSEVPRWIFCSEKGTSLDPRNVERVWARVRRRAQKLGVRPLKLHCARHTWATMALQAGKNVRWVADQLGHAKPAFTLEVYVHAMPNDETDLSFAEFGSPGRPYTAPDENGAGERLANPAKYLVELGGIEPPTLRLPA